MRERTDRRSAGRPALFLAACAIVAGCIEVEQATRIGPDGGAVFEVSVAAPEDTIQRVRSMYKLARELQEAGAVSNAPAPDAHFTALFLDPDEARLRKAFEGVPGLALRALRVDSRNAVRYLQLELAVSNLAALAALPAVRDAGGFIESAGDWIEIGKRAEVSEPVPPYSGPQEEREAAALLKGLRVRVRIRTPTPVLATSGARTADDEATWRFEFDNDPNCLGTLQNMTFRARFSRPPEWPK